MSGGSERADSPPRIAVVGAGLRREGLQTLRVVEAMKRAAATRALQRL